MIPTNRPSACPGCGAPAGKAATCDFCGSPLLSTHRQETAPTQTDSWPEVGQTSVEDWMAETPAAPISTPAPRRAEPFTPPPPSGLEPISMALNEAAQTGQSLLKRLLAACLSGCAAALVGFLGCGLASYFIFMPRGQGEFPYTVVLISLAGAFVGGLLVTLFMFLRKR